LAESIILRPRAAGEHWGWAVRGGDGSSRVGGGSIDEAARAAGGRPAVLLVAGTDVLLTRVRLPVRSRSRARSAVPWALEDRLAAEVEASHFALGEREDDHWSVAVVDRALLAELVGNLSAAGVDLVAAVPEPLALAEPPAGAWTVLAEAGRISVRTGRLTGFACEPELFAGLAAGETRPQRVVLERVAQAAEPEWPEAFAEIEQVEGTRHDAALDAFAASTQAPLNLLQGVFSRSDQRREALRRWRLPAALAAAVVAAAGVQLVIDYASLGQREAELRARVQTVYAEAFPDARATRDPQLQMRTRLQAMRGDGGGDSRFTEVLLRAGQVIDARDGVRLEALTWRGGSLEIAITAGELGLLDAVQRGLEDAELPAELRDVERNEDTVRGRLLIRAEAT